MPQEDPIKLWQHLHGASVHFALALAIVSFAFDLGSKIFQKKEWRTVGFWALVVAVVLSVPAILGGLWGQQGWFGAERWVGDDAPKETIAHMNLHRNLALVGSTILLVLLGWRSLTQDFGVHRTSTRGDKTYLLYILLSFLAAIAMGYTGYLGGYVARGY